jgi:glycogen debranching enzyme
MTAATTDQAASANRSGQQSAVPVGQPDVHDLLCCVAAPAQWLSARDGRTERGAEGLYLADRRALSILTVKISRAELRAIFSASTGSGSARFLAQIRGTDEVTGDPTVTLERIRTVHRDHAAETITVANASRAHLSTTLTLTAATDLSSVGTVRTGNPNPPLAPTVTGAGLTWRAHDGLRSELTVSGPHTPTLVSTDGEIAWNLELDPGETWSTTVKVRLGEQPTPAPGSFQLLPPSTDPKASTFDVPTVRSSDYRVTQMITQGIDDLAALCLADPADTDDVYLAAGCPWYLTLFGRDALWAARMALPLGYRAAAGTLRALARRQGRATDPATEEQPGRIPHELRTTDGATWLPPVYYGTIDATPLFVATLADAWRWGGMPADEVEALLPAAERALEWMERYGDADGDGFLEYLPANDTGLTNQGWKDSDDAVRYADGRRATAPLALCEVQAYAYEAAVQGAAMLSHFNRPGAEHWTAWAATLAERFRAAFWIDDPNGAYPAIALDDAKRPVDGPASNMGHLLGTGLLNRDEEQLVADRLAASDLASGFGLRTLSSTSAGYNPLSYHAGSVWPHDTAITAYGLHRAGHGEQAAQLLDGLFKAASTFHGRLPELYGGHPADAGIGPIPYPGACAPQAWAAATAPLALTVLLGLHVDLPGGHVRQEPPRRTAISELHVDGLRIGGEEYSITVR